MKTLFINFNHAYWNDVAKELVRIGGEISYLTTTHPEQYKNKSFKKTAVLDQTQYEYYHKVLTLNTSNTESLLKEDIDSSFKTETTFLSITDRMAYEPISVRKRKRAYYELLLYWKTFLKEKRISHVVFQSTPHGGYEIIVYDLAKKCNIKTTIIQSTPIADRLLLLDDYFSVTKIPRSKSNHLKGKLNNENRYIDELLAESSMTKSSKEKNNRVLQNKNVFLPKIKKIASKMSILSFLSYVFTRQRFFEFVFNTLPTRLSYVLYYYPQINRKLNRLRAYYKTISEPANRDDTYIVFFLHYQPERTTMPEGDIFEDQLLAIDIIAKSLPNNMKLYIKEHPAQFYKNEPWKRHFREIDDYSNMLKHNNVKLLRLEEDSNNLIQNATAVATINGTVGWEALTQDKPCLVFGRPWYAVCNSCYVIDSQESFLNALRIVKKTTRKQIKQDVYDLIDYYNEKFIISVSNKKFANKSRIPYNKLVANLAIALRNIINTS